MSVWIHREPSHRVGGGPLEPWWRPGSIFTWDSTARSPARVRPTCRGWNTWGLPISTVIAGPPRAETQPRRV